MENCWLVLTGDWGGQVYLTCPVRLIPDLTIHPWEQAHDCLWDANGIDPADLALLFETMAGQYMIKSAPESVQQLLRELDGVSWDCNEGDGCGMHIHAQRPDDPPGAGVSGGMGGGELTDGVWMHRSLRHPHQIQCAHELLGIPEPATRIGVLRQRSGRWVRWYASRVHDRVVSRWQYWSYCVTRCFRPKYDFER